MIIAVCDPKGIAIEAIKTILYHDKGLSDRIARVFELFSLDTPGFSGFLPLSYPVCGP